MEERPPDVPKAPSDPGTAPGQAPVRRPTQQERRAAYTQSDRRMWLAFAGIAFFVLGIYFLLISPGGGETISLHRLTIGETFTIVGAIFMGFAWRPKA